MNNKTIDELSIGDRAFFEKTVTEADVCLFAGISGDMNPAHINQTAAENSLFKGRIAHGMLSASLISTVLGMYLPGPGTIYLSQDLRFTYPVKINDTIKAEAEIIAIDREKCLAILKTTCRNQNGKVVIEGKATVKPPKTKL